MPGVPTYVCTYSSDSCIAFIFASVYKQNLSTEKILITVYVKINAKIAEFVGRSLIRNALQFYGLLLDLCFSVKRSSIRQTFHTFQDDTFSKCIKCRAHGGSAAAVHLLHFL